MYEREEKSIGGELGTEAAAGINRCGEQYCTAERQRIEAENHPKVMALQAKVAGLREEERDILARIEAAPPPGDFHARRRRARLLYAIAALLTVAAFVFSVLAFEPFRMGWKAWLYCLGIAVVTPFLVDLVLERWASPKLVRGLATAACVIALTGLTLLAVVRGDIFMQQAASEATPIVVNGDAPELPPETTDFYLRTLPLLRLIMAFFSIAIEVGAGIALHEARTVNANGEDASALRSELERIRELMIIHALGLWVLENEGAVFEHRFWRDFSRAVLHGIRGDAVRKLLLLVFCITLSVHGQAFAAGRVNLVILLDLSQSEHIAGYDRMMEFDKNVQGIGHLLASVPAGTTATVLGITGDSFGAPYVILKAQVPDDEGYFKERLANGRATLAKAWAARGAKLVPDCPQTDILGALMVASEIFEATPRGDRKVLFVFSDMRQATGDLNLERGSRIPVARALQRVKSKQLMANLAGVEVSLLGVDGAGKTAEYWQNLRSFWMAYFAKCGATVKHYSVLRDLSGSPAQ